MALIIGIITMNFSFRKTILFLIVLSSLAILLTVSYCVNYYFNPNKLVDNQLEGFETCINVGLKIVKEQEAEECRQYLKNKNMKCSRSKTFNECQLACASLASINAFVNSGYSEEDKVKKRCCDSVGGYFDRQCVKMQHFDLFPLSHDFLTKDVYREESGMAKIGAVDVFSLQGVPYTGTISSYHNYILGIKSRETIYVSGILEGIETYWYPDNHVEKTISWKGGFKDGQLKKWFNNGQLESQYDYVVGVKTYKDSTSGFSHPESKCCANQQYWNPDGSQRARTLEELRKDLDLKADLETHPVILQYRKKYKRSSVHKYCYQSDIGMAEIDYLWDILEEYYIVAQTNEAHDKKWTSKYIEGVMRVILGDHTQTELELILEQKKLPSSITKSRRSQRKVFTKDVCLAYFNFANKVNLEKALRGDSSTSFDWIVE